MPDKIQQMQKNEEMERSIELYIRARKSLSSSTQMYYLAILHQLNEFVNKPIEKVDKLDILRFLDYLQEVREWKNSSLNTAIYAVRSFFGYFKRPELLEGIERYREDDNERPYVTEENFQAMVELAGKEPHKLAVRDQCMLTMLFATGVRASELLGLNLDDVDLVERYATVLGKGRGGKKLRYVPIAPSAVKPLRTGLEIRDTMANPGETAIFVSSRGKRLSYTSLYARVKKYTIGIGRPELATHSYRHGCLTKITAKTGNIRLAQTVAGHSKILTTERYVHVSKEHARGAIDEVFG